MMNSLFSMMNCETMKGVLTKYFQNPVGNNFASFFKKIDYQKYKGMPLKDSEWKKDSGKWTNTFKEVKNFTSKNE